MRRVGRNLGSEDREGCQGVSRNAPTRSGGGDALLTVSRAVGMRDRGEQRGDPVRWGLSMRRRDPASEARC